MKKITLELKHMTTKSHLHAYLKRELEFPGYYGENLDALHDCLTDIQDKLSISIPQALSSEDGLGDYGKTVIRVFRDAAKTNHHIKVTVRRRN